MDDQVLHWLWRNRLLVGGLAVLLSAATWTVDLTGLVYVCPFCRTQRTVIGLLGIMMMLPTIGHFLSRYVATVFAGFGFVVGAMQHFRGWQRIMSGKFEWGENWYVNSWMLSGFALFIITGLLLLMWSWRPDAPTEDEPNEEHA
jgi:protein-S-isoprenylcysteine O-methyltransferase Ste14